MLGSFHCLLFSADGFIAGLLLGLLAFKQCKRIALKLKTKINSE